MTQDRPSAPELLEAVAEYLFGELRPEVPREQRFKVLVAANLCAVVARELRAGQGPSRQDLNLFRELLGGDGGAEPVGGGESSSSEVEARRLARELASRLRTGELDDRLGELAPRLAEHVRRKLEVARPGYDA